MPNPLTLDDVRAFVTTPLSDDALQAFVDAAWSAIVSRYGETGEVTEVHRGGQSVLALKRPVQSVTSIIETVGDTTTELTADDYLFAVGSQWLTRQSYGPNYAYAWAPQTEIAYVPVDDTADRIRVEVKLIELELNNKPGLTGYQTGEDAETYAANSAYNYSIEREDILASLGQAAGAPFA